MQSTNKSEGKKRGIHKYLALVSVGFFAAALLAIIFFFNSSLDLLGFVSAFVVLGIAFLGSSLNVARFNNQSVAVRVLAKISLVANIVAAIMIVLIIAGVPSYSNCDYSCSDLMCSQGQEDCYYTCSQEYECIKNADGLAEILIKITGIAIVLSLAGEIIGRYLAYKTTKKFINITRWAAIVLTTLLSLMVIFFLIFNSLFTPLVAQITFCICALCLLAVVGTPILLLVENKHTKQV